MDRFNNFLENYGDMESWNTDKMFIDDALHNIYGLSSLSFIRQLKEMIDNEESIEYIKEEIQNIRKKEIEYNEELPEKLMLHSRFRSYHIPISRIKKGFNEGFIDAISHAYAKTDNGWVNESLEVVISKEASLEDIIKEISKKSIIIESLSVKELKEISKKEKIEINGKIIARKNENGDWINEFGKTFHKDEVVRVIAHSNEPVYTYMGISNQSYFHGNLSDKIEEDSEHKLRDYSIQGKAAYATGDLNEAIAYANPYGFETSGKLISLQESGEIKNRKDFIFGHLYEVSPGLSSLYVANKNYSPKSFMQKPSIASLLLMCRMSGGNEIFVSRKWIDLINSENKYDNYAIMNELNNYFIQHDKSFESLKKMISSLGFDGIKTDFPNEEEIKNIREKIKEFIEEFPMESYNDKKIKEELLSSLEKGMKSIKSGIPSRAKKEHLILFNMEEMTRSHLKLLPFNNGGFMDQDELYKPENKITKEELIKLESPSFDDAKKFFIKRDSKKNEFTISFD